MLMIQSPPSFVIRTEAQKAAWDNGFRLERGVRDGWIGYASTTAPGEVWIAAASDTGPWYLALTHPGVAAELFEPDAPAATGRPAWQFETTAELHEAVDRAYRLGISLPDAPLLDFEARTRGLPRTTETERLVVQRIGQDVFRDALMQYWGGRCPMTGIADPDLLRASHIVAWAECDDDAHRLDVHNGLLLSALWDAAFDRGLVSFDDDGGVLASPRLSEEGRDALGLDFILFIPGLTDAHRANLRRHRERFGPFEPY